MSSRARSPLVLLLLVSSCHVHSGLVPTGMSPLVRLFLSYLRSVFSCPVLLSCWLLSCLLMSCLLSSPLVLSTLVLSRRSLGAFWRAVEASWKPLRSLWGDLLGPLASLRRLILALLTACPGSPGPPPELSWEAWAPPWAALGGSWRLLGLSWAALGPSWRLLGGPFGASQAALGAP